MEESLKEALSAVVNAALEGHQIYGTGHPTPQRLLQGDRSCHSSSTLQSGVSDSTFLRCNSLHKFS